MTIATTSLENLIPNVPKWEGFTTAPVRVPAELKNWVIDMVNQKVQELRIMIGADAPADQSEQEWVNEILGLPSDHQPGDPLPLEVAAAVAESKAERVATQAEQVSIEQPAVAASAIAVIDPEPPEFTRAWLGWAARKDSSFNEPGYISDVKQEAAGGDPSAKRDLARLVADGVDIGEPLPSQKVTRRQAKQARRLERQKKAAGGNLQTVPVPVIDPATVQEYNQVLAIYNERLSVELDRFKDFYVELDTLGLQGKLRRFNNFLWESLPELMPDFVQSLQSAPPLCLESFAKDSERQRHNRCVEGVLRPFEQAFRNTPTQQSEGNLDGRFYSIISDIFYCWPMAEYIAANPD